jgi:hypothetical protein
MLFFSKQEKRHGVVRRSVSIRPSNKIYEMPPIKRRENERTPEQKKPKKKKPEPQKGSGKVDIRV